MNNETERGPTVRGRLNNEEWGRGAAFFEHTEDKVPFSDWYDTVSGRHYHFQNRTVQGGFFRMLLADEWEK
jgi:hypothetical protein